MSDPRLAVFWHEDVLRHDTGQGLFEAPDSDRLEVSERHPENAVRVRNMRSVLMRGSLSEHLTWFQGRHATIAELERVHTPGYIEEVRSLCASGGGRMTATTVLGPDSWEALLAAAGTSLAAAEAVLNGSERVAYALVRPPGHHAQPAQADGYCFFSHCALIAETARLRGIERIAVIDWDVHHGNGTQACFWERSDVLTVSLHMPHGAWGLSHPQTGGVDELGMGVGQGFNINVPLEFGMGDSGYLRAFSEVIDPIVRAFDPGLIVVACGQDASAFDPNGRQCVSMAGFYGLGAAVMALAKACCDGRIVLVQEGGYARTYAAFCLQATLEGVLGVVPKSSDPLAFYPDDRARGAASIEAARTALQPFWPVLAKQ